MTKEQAARTAATSLESIERWGRMTALAAIVAAGASVATTAIVGYAALEYLAMKRGMAEVAREYGKPARAPSPPRLR